MCGIFASVGMTPPAAAIDAVAHRGPDGRGWKQFDSAAGPVVLAHRRLAIIDTSPAGLQPMAWGDERWWITCNGEIYNYLELRRELEERGHRFRTESDTEVVLAAYAQWQEACLDRFIGMFAFVLYDREGGRVFAARDRFGIKPLYYWRHGRDIAFASEIKQFAALPGFAAQTNRARAYDFLAAGLFDHSEETLFAGVSQLRGGQYMLLDLARWRGDGAAAPRRWYRLPPANTLDRSEAEAAEEFRALLVEAVRLHLRADVTVGSCLSGGLDSSSIVCLAAEALDNRQARRAFCTVSACYAEKSVDESAYVDAVVMSAGVASARVHPGPDELAARAETIARHQDEPFGSTSVFAQWCVFERAAAERVKVMLDGQGADEQLAGYHGSFPLYYRQLVRAGAWRQLARTLAARRRVHGAGWAGEATAVAAALLPAALRSRLVGTLRAREAKAWIGAGLVADRAEGGTPAQAALARDGFGPVDGLGESCRAQLQTTTLPMLLHYEDRSSMAHGVEARVPFLDHRLDEFSVALGDRHKTASAETKRILRLAMANTLPALVRERSDKLGFATPEEIWLKGPLRRFAHDGVQQAIAWFPDFFDAGGLQRMTRGMLEGNRPFDFALWRVISLGLWGRAFRVAA
jgi:asparagine synthase (glutamine-hydrolysing)